MGDCAGAPLLRLLTKNGVALAKQARRTGEPFTVRQATLHVKTRLITFARANDIKLTVNRVSMPRFYKFRTTTHISTSSH